MAKKVKKTVKKVRAMARPSANMARLPEPKPVSLGPDDPRPWKVVLSRLEGEYATEAEARRRFDQRSRSLAAGERLTFIKT